MERMLLRNSERKTWRRCRWKWDLNYHRRLAPIQTKDVLAFGTLVHSALEEWYPPGLERGEHPARAFERLFDESVDHEMIQWDDDGERLNARELGVEMLEGYVRQWSTDPHLEVVWPEHPFATDIFSGVRKKKPKRRYLATLVGRFDLVFFNHLDGRYWLSDHKTAKQIKTDHLQLDDQAGGYLLSATNVLRNEGVLEPDEEIAGILYNYLRKALPDDRPQDELGRYLNKPAKAALQARCETLGLQVPRKATVDVLADALRAAGERPELLGEVSKVQPPPLFLRQPVYRSDASRRELIRRIRNEAREIIRAREGTIPIYKNPTQDCSWDCDFFDVCVTHEEGADWEELLSQLYEEWDPYDTEDRDLLNVARLSA